MEIENKSYLGFYKRYKADQRTQVRKAAFYCLKIIGVALALCAALYVLIVLMLCLT